MEGFVDISEEQNGGILKKILVKGDEKSGCPFNGDTVSVHYTGTLASDGSKFDSSVDRGQKFQFNLGKGEVIKGWDVGVASMFKGEKALFHLKPEFAYGETGSPPKIPANAELIFEVELFDFSGEDLTKDKDSGILKRVRVPGSGFDHPNDGGSVEIDVKGSLTDDLSVVFDDRKALKFVLGEGLDSEIPRGLELALEKMKKGEEARIEVKNQYGFGPAGCEKLKVPPGNVNLTYDVKLISFERAKESWQLDGEEKLEQALIFKERGTFFFKNGKYELAVGKYEKIIEFLEHEVSLKGESETKRRETIQAGRLNLAMCYLKLGKWIEARDICDKVIEENDKSEKAFFRRGEARFHLNDHDLAKKDYERVLELDPNNKAAKNRVIQCNAKIKAQKEKEKKTFANMFEKFAKYDAKKEEEAKKKIKPVEISDWNGKDKTNENHENDTMKVSGDVEMDIDLNKELNNENNEMTANNNS